MPWAKLTERLRKDKYNDGEAALLMWFIDARDQQIPILLLFSKTGQINMPRALVLMISSVVIGGLMDSNVVTTYSST